LQPSDHRAVRLSLLAVVMLAGAAFLTGAPEMKQLSVYSATANFTLPVTERNGTDYVALLDLLQRLGQVSARADGRVWRVRYGGSETELTDGGTQVRLQGQTFDMPGAFLLENSRGLVPLNSLSILISRLLWMPVDFHESSRRLLIGNVAVHFTAQVSPTNPPTLVMNFTSPVNPMIATEPGKLRMVFTHEPLVPPGSPTLTFNNPAIPSATFLENNGAAEIAVNGPVSLFASFSNDGRTITIAPAPQVAARTTAPAPAPAAIPPILPSPAVAPPPTASPMQYFVVVDPSHGGDERGAALGDQLAEKDVTLGFARRLGQELDMHGLTTLLLRDGDMTLGLDQRANMSNTAHPSLYICLHAASQGAGVRLYTAVLPAGGENRGAFLDWNTAQSGFRVASQTAESSLATEFGKRQIPVRNLAAPLRPLNNLAAAAVAIEIAPLSGKIADLSSVAYQQLVAESVAAGIEAVRDKLAAPPGVTGPITPAPGVTR
jgi:N-acetylmuramoyl-L-alanine amidase